MLRAYSNNITAVANQPIVFNTDKLDTDSSIVHTGGSANILVRRSGYFEVNLTISATTATAVTDPISIQLFANGVAIPDAIATATFTQDSYSNLSFDTIIRANPGMLGQTVTLTVVPTNDLTISNISIGIIRAQ